MICIYAPQKPDALEAAIVEISRLAYEKFRADGYGDRYTPQHFQEPLRNLLRDNSDKSAEELRSMAIALTPGSVHNNCMLYYMAMERIFWPCPKLVAAIIALTWGGGRIGFQHMPDPQTADVNEYDEDGDDLLDIFREISPEEILVGHDRAFYDALPERFSIYRGGYGVTPDILALGLCWTTHRDTAEWFATRGIDDHERPVLLSARVRKSDVFLAFATEHEIVLKPSRWRELKCRRRKSDRRRPESEWLPPVEPVFILHDG